MESEINLADVSGLSNQEAQAGLERVGPNELPTSKPRKFFHVIAEVLQEPMVFLLLGAGAIYLVLGDRQEAFSLLGFLFLIIGITVYQELKTEKALSALRELSSPRALVIREKKKIRIPGREVVPGDVLVLAEGDRIAADGILIAGTYLSADESLLTGESMPVEKRRAEKVFAGTTVVRGHGYARVESTGVTTELGKIGKSLQHAAPEDSRLQKEARHLVYVLATSAAALCIAVMVIYALTRDDWLGGVLVGLTLAMAILPNELPAVLLIFLAMGAWRLSKNKVLTRRIPAVETLGSATVLCVDKTGTLTQNRMTIRMLWNCRETLDLRDQSRKSLPEEFHEIVEYGILACRPEPFDPMERAFHSAGTEYLALTEHLHADWALLKEYPISEALLAVSYAWKARKTGFVVGAKGAPEAIVDLCHLPEDQAEKVRRQVRTLASEGLRVLGIAKAFTESTLPREQHDLDFDFLGLIALADPIREDVPRAIDECRAAGIRIVMITGDHPETARSIARQIGLSNPDRILLGTDLSTLSEGELQERLRTVNVFSRTLPEQKLALVRAFKKMGEVVAMTGDGVNDAPALKHADIGVAMGQRGTDVAREAASLVLLEDDFLSIVAAVRMGRRVFANLRNALAYLLSIHVPIAALSVIPVVFKLPMVLLPIHIAFLHMIIEPACTVAFEADPERADVMKRPPRKSGEPLFGKKTIRGSLIQGIWVTFSILGVFLVSHGRGLGEGDVRALTFTTLIVANLGLILSNRCWALNRIFAWIALGSGVLLAVVLYIPPLRSLFRFSHLHPSDLLICLVAGILGVALNELGKRVRFCYH